MLAPKKVKWRKMQKGRRKGTAWRGATLAFGDYGLQAVERGWVRARGRGAAGGARDSARGQRTCAGRAAPEPWTVPRERGRPSARALRLADGVRGQRKRAGRAAPEHWTGPRES